MMIELSEEIADTTCPVPSAPCVAGKVRVQTPKGWVCADGLAVGDDVVTADGLRRVTACETGGLTQVMTVEPSNAIPLHCTPDQRFLVRREHGAAEWMPAEYLDESCCLGFPLPVETGIPAWGGIDVAGPDGGPVHLDSLSDCLGDEWFWHLVGCYLATGTVGTGDDAGKVLITLYDSRSRWIRLPHAVIGCRHGSPVVRVDSPEFTEFCLQAGRRKERRRIPPEWMGLPRGLAQSMVRGITRSRGRVWHDGWSMGIYSKQLVLDLVRLIGYAYHSPATVRREELEGGKPVYYMTLGRDQRGRAFYEDGWIWSPVRRIVPCEPDMYRAFRISVEGGAGVVINGSVVRPMECTEGGASL